MEMIVGVGLFVVGACAGYWLGMRSASQTTDTSAQDALWREQLAEAKARLTEMEHQVRDYTASLATLDAEKRALNEKLGEQQHYLEKAQAQLQQQFENLAHKIFEEKNAQAKQNLSELLKPLSADLTGFKEHIQKSFGEHAKEQFALKKEIENVVKASSDMRLQTESLTKALKGDVKVQGNWGEMILERILESSGLQKGVHYIPQGTGMELKHPETGSLQKPDFILHMPEGKHAIIDAKVSLTAYERFCAEEHEAARATHMAQFLQSVRAHVKGLEDRRYQDTVGLNSPEYVLMFIPIEGAYALAMQQDAELHAHAWDRKIIIVCPGTLFAILKMMHSMWRLDDQNRNVGEIVRRGGLLYDKFAGFVEDLVSVGDAIDRAHAAYEGAYNKLAKGSGNLLNQATDLVKLGAKASKKLPKKVHADIDMGPVQTPEMLSITSKEDAA